MKRRKLGQSAITVAPLMFGGNVFGWTADEATSHKLLDGFVAGGFNFVDTADMYSRWAEGHQGGESEKVIGTWLRRRGRRDERPHENFKLFIPGPPYGSPPCPSFASPSRRSGRRPRG